MKKAMFIMDLKYVADVYSDRIYQQIGQQVDIINEPISKAMVSDYQEALSDVDIIFSGWGGPYMDESFLAMAPKLSMVFYAAGTIKPIVSPAFWQRKIRITTANSANAVAVSEYTLAAIIMGLKGAFRHQVALKRDKQYPDYWSRHIIGAKDSVVGLISYGAIGKRVRALLKQIDVNVVVYDPFLSAEAAQADNVTLVDLPTLFKMCDVVSVHTPLLPSTEKMINQQLLSTLKPYATFINTARGAVVDEAGLIEVLRQRPDVTAYLDVVYPEPPLPTSPLYDLENVFLTPHLAGSEGGEVSRMGDLMYEEFQRYLQNESLLYEVSESLFKKMA